MVALIGSYGFADGHLNNPSDVALDSQGNLWVADTDNYRVQKFDANGKFLMKFGEYGYQDGQIQKPTGVTVDSEGSVWVIDGTSRIQKFNSSGKFILKVNWTGWAGTSFTATAIDIDPQDNLWVADDNYNCIHKFDTDGKLLISVGRENGNGIFIDPIDIITDQEGNVWILESYRYRLRKVDNTGKILTTLDSNGSGDGQLNNPVCMSVDEQNNLWLVDWGGGGGERIQKFDQNGFFLTKFGVFKAVDGQPYFPYDVAVDKQNNLWILEEKKIQKFNRTGKFLMSFEGPTLYPRCSFTVDEQENIWVLDGFYTVYKYDSGGTLLMKFGTYGYNDGQFYNTGSISVDGKGDIWVNDHTNRIQKFDPTGKFLLKFSNADYVSGRWFDGISRLTIDEQDNIWVADASGILKLDINGKLLMKFGSIGVADGQFKGPSDITIDKQGNLYITDSGNNRIQKFDKSGKFVSKIDNISSIRSLVIDQLYNLYCISDIGVLLYSNNIYESVVETVISGKIYSDENKNCLFDSADKPTLRAVVVAQPGKYYGVSDQNGNYLIQVDTGTYTVSQVINNTVSRLIQPSCPANNQSPEITLKTLGDSVRNINFANKVTLLPYLSANVNSNRRRRCFTSVTTIVYSNTGYADAANAKVYLELPKHVLLKSASKPYVLDKDSVYVFSIGTLKANESGSIQITDSVACVRNITGLTACTKVWITPSNNYTLPPNSPWDNSDITLSGKCIENGRVRLVIKNTGQLMADSAEFRVLLDAQLALRKNFKLAKGDSLVLRVPANGKTVRLEADQRPGHLRKSQSNLTIEGCVASVSDVVSKGFVNALPQDDAEPEVSIDCQPIIDSFDPNDKQVSPIGTTVQHYTPTNAELKYLIRFQNTGTDTAYKVVVVDTLSEHLDIATLQVGAASHKYSFNVSGKGRPVLTWTFNNINLPDSAKNEPASNGFIQFSIKPKENLAEKTRIENFADIFFDYNDPVRTNTTTNVLYDVPPVIENSVRLNETEVVLSSEQPQWSRTIVVYPNPSNGKLTIDLSQSRMQVQEIEVRNSLGQKIVSKKITKPAQAEELDLSENGAGLYIILFKTNQGNATRKIVLK